MQDYPNAESSQERNSHRTKEPAATDRRNWVLVVDDDHDIRRLNNLALVQSGYRADTAEDGAVAWEMLQLNTYDLLITDHNMPRISGVELLVKLHTAEISIPVIMATGEFPEFHFRSRPWLQPPTALLKPFTGEELLNVVKAVLEEAVSRSTRTVGKSRHTDGKSERGGA